MKSELTERAAAPSAYSNGKLSLTVIQPGVSKNNRYYSPELLKKSYGIFEGCKMFADHATDSESKQRPEGSVNNWVASIDKVWAESDGTVKATAVVVDEAFKQKLTNLAKAGLLSQMGVSIRAFGEASDGEVGGKKVKIIESLDGARSVDFVTFAGAGGQVEAIESDGGRKPADIDAAKAKLSESFQAMGFSKAESDLCAGIEADPIVFGDVRMSQLKP
ncbi:MAG TPA: hypothetical protein VNY29_17835 [Terriglobales bacterium]|jgi:hypothetical protein|nr:hypothetical protein [Terriglobales bacterium]